MPRAVNYGKSVHAPRFGRDTYRRWMLQIWRFARNAAHHEFWYSADRKKDPRAGANVAAFFPPHPPSPPPLRGKFTTGLYHRAYTRPGHDDISIGRVKAARDIINDDRWRNIRPEINTVVTEGAATSWTSALVTTGLCDIYRVASSGHLYAPPSPGKTCAHAKKKLIGRIPTKAKKKIPPLFVAIIEDVRFPIRVSFKIKWIVRAEEF